MDGVEVARRIRQEVGREIPVIVLTAYDWSEIEAEAREAGVSAFLAKPFYRSKICYLLSGLSGEKEPVQWSGFTGKSDFTGKRVLLVEDNEMNRVIMRTLLEEFPAKEVRFFLPKWMESLQMDHPLKQEMIQAIRSGMDKVAKLRDIPAYVAGLSDNPRVKKIHMDDVDMAQGEATVEVQMDDHLFYDILTEMTGLPIQSERQLISTISSLAEAKKEYEKVDYAFKEAMNRGYGIVNPLMDALTLEDPMIVRQGSKYGVKIKAKAPSVHLIRTDVETEINPFVGTQQQSEDFVNYLNQEMKEEPSKVWDSEIFGKSLYELVNEGLNNKLVKMPEDAQLKLQETLEKVINEGRGGLICIIL